MDPQRTCDREFGAGPRTYLFGHYSGNSIEPELSRRRCRYSQCCYLRGEPFVRWSPPAHRRPPIATRRRRCTAGRHRSRTAPTGAGTTSANEGGPALGRRGHGPGLDRDGVAMDITELAIDPHTVLLGFTYTSRRGQSAVALISY